MFTATVKGMLAHKVRAVLTSLSIALGVAFLAGTLMLTDSMQRAFDDIFSKVSEGTDVAVRTVAAPDGGGAPTPVTDSLLPTVRSVDGVASAEGQVSGYALLTDVHGKPIQSGVGVTVGLESQPRQGPAGRRLAATPGGRPRVPARWPSTPARPRRAISSSARRSRSCSRGQRRSSPSSASCSSRARTTSAAPPTRSSTPPRPSACSARPASTTPSRSRRPRASARRRWHERVSDVLPGGIEAVTGRLWHGEPRPD